MHPPIKKALCGWATGNRSWLAKVRPYYGHTYHFHIRMRCPSENPGCTNQPSSGTRRRNRLWPGTFLLVSDKPWAPEKPPPKKKPPAETSEPLLLSNLPSDCRGLLNIQ